MKKVLITLSLCLTVFAILSVAAVSYHKNELEKAYDDSYFLGYADGYLKHKHNPESNEYFASDEKANEYVSVMITVYTTPDMLYHRKGCAKHVEEKILDDIFNEYSPCESCEPPIIVQ